MRPRYRRNPSQTASPPCTAESNGLTAASSRWVSRPATLTIRSRFRSSNCCSIANCSSLRSFDPWSDDRRRVEVAVRREGGDHDVDRCDVRGQRVPRSCGISQYQPSPGRLSAGPVPLLVTESMECLVEPVRPDVAFTLLALPRLKTAPTPEPDAAPVMAITAAAVPTPMRIDFTLLNCIS